MTSLPSTQLAPIETNPIAAVPCIREQVYARVSSSNRHPPSDLCCYDIEKEWFHGAQTGTTKTIIEHEISEPIEIHFRNIGHDDAEGGSLRWGRDRIFGDSILATEDEWRNYEVRIESVGRARGKTLAL